MEKLEWSELKNKKPEDVLNEKELEIYKEALLFFEELFNNSTIKQRHEFAKSMLGISSYKFAHRYSDPHKQPNLYKMIYKIMMDYNYNRL